MSHEHSMGSAVWVRKPSSECVRQPAGGKQATCINNFRGWLPWQQKPEACGAGCYDAALSPLGRVLLRFRSAFCECLFGPFAGLGGAFLSLLAS